MGKTSKVDFFTDMRPPLFIVVSKVTHVRVGLRIGATAFSSGNYSTGASIEYDIEKEVSSESIAVLSREGHF